MAKLILSLDGAVLNEFPLTKERTSIGRKPHNDIQIDNLAVSGEHAVIVTIANDCFLEDIGSTNGTLVNGTPVKKHMLRNNDVIELGKYKLVFFGKSAAATPAPEDYDKTMVWRPAASKPAPAPSGTPAPAGAAAVNPVQPVQAIPAIQAGAATAKPPAAPGGAAVTGARTDARAVAAPARAGIKPGKERKPIWQIGLLLLLILVFGFLTFGTRG